MTLREAVIELMIRVNLVSRDLAESWTAEMDEVELARRFSWYMRQILSALVERGGEPISVEELAKLVGRTPGGSFSARISEVRSSGLLVDAGRGLVAANKQALFLEDSNDRRAV
jgi:hypothetical protein